MSGLLLRLCRRSLWGTIMKTIHHMRNELLAWFAREGLLLQDVTTSAEDPQHDEVKVTIKAPIVALSKAADDFRECPDPVVFGYPDSSLDMMNLDDFHNFVYQWFEKA